MKELMTEKKDLVTRLTKLEVLMKHLAMLTLVRRTTSSQSS